MVKLAKWAQKSKFKIFVFNDNFVSMNFVEMMVMISVERESSTIVNYNKLHVYISIKSV